MASFQTAYYTFKGKSIKVDYWREGVDANNPKGDRTCMVARTPFGNTEKVCRMNASEAKSIVLAQARLKIKKAGK